MVPKEKNSAYIDGANLDKGVKDLGWKLDYKREKKKVSGTIILNYV